MKVGAVIVTKQLLIGAGVAILFAAGSHAGASSQVRPRGSTKVVSRAKKSTAPKGKFLFLDQERVTPPRREWNREIVFRRSGKMRFVITGSPPFGVTLVTDNGRSAMLRGDRSAFRREDLILTVDSRSTTFTSEVSLPPGHYWFYLENQSDRQVVFRLQCYVIEPRPEPISR